MKNFGIQEKLLELTYSMETECFRQKRKATKEKFVKYVSHRHESENKKR